MIEARFYLENILQNNATYTVNIGSDAPSAPFSNAFDYVASNPALPFADANGVFEVTLTTDNFVHPFGSLGYSEGEFGGVITPMAFIIGVSRHQLAFNRFAGGRLELLAGTQILVDDDLTNVRANSNIVYELPSHTTGSYTLRISNLQPNSVVTLPMLYIGNYYLLGGYSYGFDSYPDAGHYRQTRSEANIGYDELRYVQWNGKYNFPYIQDVGTLRFLREVVVEKSKPFFFQPDANLSLDVYLVKQRNNFLAESVASAIHTTAQVDLIEWL